MRWGISLLLALGAHLGILFVRWRSPPRKPVEVVPLAELLPSSQRGGKTAGRGRGGKGGRGGLGNASRLGLRDFLPGLGNPSDGVRFGGDGSGDGSGTFDAVGLELMPLIPFFEALWTKIDRGVIYPQDFSDNWIEGKVYVKLTVDGRGVWRNEPIRLRSENGILKKYILL